MTETLMTREELCSELSRFQELYQKAERELTAAQARAREAEEEVNRVSALHKGLIWYARWETEVKSNAALSTDAKRYQEQAQDFAKGMAASERAREQAEADKRALEQALERLGKYPQTPADELSADQMRRIARLACAAIAKELP